MPTYDISNFSPELKKNGTAAYLFLHDERVTDVQFASFLLAQLQMEPGRRLTAEELLRHPFLTGETVALAGGYPPITTLQGDTGLFAMGGQGHFHDLRMLGEKRPLPEGIEMRDAHGNFLAVYKKEEREFHVKILASSLAGPPHYEEVASFPAVEGTFLRWDIRLNDEYLVVVAEKANNTARVLVSKGPLAADGRGGRPRQWDAEHELKKTDFGSGVNIYIASLVGDTLTLYRLGSNTVVQLDLGAGRESRVELPFGVWYMRSPLEARQKGAAAEGGPGGGGRGGKTYFANGVDGGFYAVDLEGGRAEVEKICHLPFSSDVTFFGTNSVMVGGILFSRLDQLRIPSLPASGPGSSGRGGAREGSNELDVVVIEGYRVVPVGRFLRVRERDSVGWEEEVTVPESELWGGGFPRIRGARRGGKISWEMCREGERLFDEYLSRRERGRDTSYPPPR